MNERVNECQAMSETWQTNQRWSRKKRIPNATRRAQLHW
jgi:hypothetical protein